MAFSLLLFPYLSPSSCHLCLSLFLSLYLSPSFSLSLSPSRALGLEPRSRPQPTQKCWDCKACGHFSCRYHQVGGCARLLLAGGMLNITATYSRIISATGRSAKGEGEEEMVVCLPGLVGGGRRNGALEGVIRKGRKAPAIRTSPTCDFRVRSPALRFRGFAERAFWLCPLALLPPPPPRFAFKVFGR